MLVDIMTRIITKRKINLFNEKLKKKILRVYNIQHTQYIHNVPGLNIFQYLYIALSMIR